MPISITLDGKAGRRSFDWEGDDSAVVNAMRKLEEIAASGGFPAMQFSISVVMQTLDTGLYKDGLHQIAQGQMLAILYFVLNAPVDHAGLPGKVSDYVADQQINALLGTHGEKINLRLESSGSDIDQPLH